MSGIFIARTFPVFSTGNFLQCTIQYGASRSKKGLNQQGEFIQEYLRRTDSSITRFGVVVWKGASSYYFHNASLLFHNVFSNFTTLRSVALCSTNFHNSSISLIIQSVPICFIHFHILSFIFMISNSIFQHFVHFHNISSIYKSIILENIDT